MAIGASKQNILITGGDGRLGTALSQFIDFQAPLYPKFDITEYDNVLRTFKSCKPKLIVHAAAYTNVAGAEIDRLPCWKTNVIGTRNVVKAVRELNLPLIHISTDYVFDGKTGNYMEDDCPGPAINYYSLTKMVAEEVVRTWEKHLIIRTSFRPNDWPYPVAYTDLFTGQDYLDIIAPEIALAIQNVHRIPHNTLHIVTERKSAFELAKRRCPDVKAGSKKSSNVALPDDITLNTDRWNHLKKILREKV
jgi:dTDP-4-dehydrorhamnose reductase